MLGLRWSWQNLKNDEKRHTHGLHGRGWLHWPSRNGWIDSSLSFEWHTGSPVHLFGFIIDVTRDEDPVSVALYCWPCSFYVSVESRFVRWLAPHLVGPKWSDERTISVTVNTHDLGTIRWNLWTPDSSWSSKTPKWRNGHWCPVDSLCGRWDYKNVVLSTEARAIELPEGSYAAEISMEAPTWTRRRRLFRWWVRRVSRATIEVKDPPMFAGKGENSYDLDDDCIYSMSCPAESVDEAVQKYRDAVLKSRKKYGNPVTLKAAAS